MKLGPFLFRCSLDTELFGLGLLRFSPRGGRHAGGWNAYLFLGPIILTVAFVRVRP